LRKYSPFQKKYHYFKKPLGFWNGEEMTLSLMEGLRGRELFGRRVGITNGYGEMERKVNGQWERHRARLEEAAAGGPHLLPVRRRPRVQQAEADAAILDGWGGNRSSMKYKSNSWNIAAGDL